MTFRCGVTLTSGLSASQAMLHVSNQIDRENVLGSVMAVLCRSKRFDTIDIECAIDNLEPAQAVNILRVVMARLRILHHVEIKDDADPVAIRKEAEELYRFSQVCGAVGHREEVIHRIERAIANGRAPT